MNVILEHGGMAKDICELITTLNDHLTQKIIILAEEAMVREGLRTASGPLCLDRPRQRGPAGADLEDRSGQCHRFCRCLSRERGGGSNVFSRPCGKGCLRVGAVRVPRCKGGIMAVNPKWCQPFRVWKDYYRHWIVDFDYPAEEILADLDLFRLPAYLRTIRFGDPDHGHFSRSVSIERKSFLRDMAETAVLHETPSRLL